jgi:hypothetical protein
VSSEGANGCIDLTSNDNTGLADIVGELRSLWAPVCELFSLAEAKVAVEVLAPA